MLGPVPLSLCSGLSDRDHSITFVQKGAPRQHSIVSSSKALTLRLHVLKNKLAALLYQFYNFNVHILSFYMRAIYTARLWGRNGIILLMCAQTALTI